MASIYIVNKNNKILYKSISTNLKNIILDTYKNKKN